MSGWWIIAAALALEAFALWKNPIEERRRPPRTKESEHGDS